MTNETDVKTQDRFMVVATRGIVQVIDTAQDNKVLKTYNYAVSVARTRSDANVATEKARGYADACNDYVNADEAEQRGG